MAGRDDTHRLGWLGIGRMGMEMGRRLLEAGCDLAVFNRSMGKAEPLIRLGAKPAGSAAELAARDIVFVTVGSSDDLMLVASPNGRAAARRRAMEQLDFVGIAGHHAELAGTLSYGQRKLLELAYVLVADPAVVLLDEPAGGVNLSLVNHIADRIRELNAAGKTFLIVEHNMPFQPGSVQAGGPVPQGAGELGRERRRVGFCQPREGDPDARRRRDAEPPAGGYRPARSGGHGHFLSLP